jgi:hypothetical protein
VEEGHELAAGGPHGHLGDALGAAEGEVLDGGEHVLHVLEGDVLEGRELEAVVLDEGHAVAVHAEEDFAGGAAQEHAAHDVADVVHAAAPGEVRGLDDGEERGLEREREQGAEEHGVEALELGRERGARVLLLGEEQARELGAERGVDAGVGGDGRGVGGRGVRAGGARAGRRSACGVGPRGARVGPRGARPEHSSLGEGAAREEQRGPVEGPRPKRLRCGGRVQKFS